MRAQGLHNAARLAWLCGLAAAGLVTVGCQKSGPSPVSAPAEPEVVLKAPEDAARTLLVLLRAHLQAVARHDRVAADRYRDRVAEQVAAREDVLGRYRTIAEHAAKDEAGVVRELVENWAAILSYYAEGLEPTQIKLLALNPTTGSAVVEVPARGANDTGWIRIACRRQTGDLWRVSSLEVGPRRAAPTSAPSQPAAQTTPATQPASRPG